jgi:CheY-like chemotaxis protein
VGAVVTFWDIAVASEVGQGTTFKVYLPRVEVPALSGKSHHAPGAIPRGSETILLVEDEDGVRALSRHVLQGCGYTVLEARDGAEALRIAEQHRERIDLLVTDVVMPRTGGREVADRLAEMQPRVKVLFVSGYMDDAVVRHGIREAEEAFLQKPFSATSLAVKVREVLARSEAPSSRASQEEVGEGDGSAPAAGNTLLTTDVGGPASGRDEEWGKAPG